MSHTPSRREFMIKVASVSAAMTAGASLSACGGSSAPAEFLYGVASGDPLADRVILWTHAKFPGSDGAVTLRYQVASDAAFTQIVS
jgi:alkaline phosphatase D